MSSTIASTSYPRPIILPEIDPASAKAPLDGQQLHAYYKQYVEKGRRKYIELKALKCTSSTGQKTMTDVYKVETGDLRPGAVQKMVPATIIRTVSDNSPYRLSFLYTEITSQGHEDQYCSLNWHNARGGLMLRLEITKRTTLRNHQRPNSSRKSPGKAGSWPQKWRM